MSTSRPNHTTTATGRKAVVTWAAMSQTRTGNGMVNVSSLWDVVLDGTEAHCLLTDSEVADLLLAK